MRPLTVLAIGIAVGCSGCATGLTGSPALVSQTDAVINGKVVSDTGGEVEYWVQYGPTRAYGSESPHENILADSNQLLSVTPFVDGLSVATSYHYRVCASDAEQKGGPGCGEDRRFTTQTVGCGSIVTSSVKLTGTLLCPQEPGLIVGANGVEIDLGGHTLDGGISVGGGGPRAIDNSGGFDDLTVRNGSAVGWGDAIYLVGGDRNRVVNVNASAANTGVRIQGGSGDEIRNSDVFGRSTGIAASGADRLLVQNNEALAAFNSAIAVNGSFAQITDNRIVRSGGPLSGDPAIGLVGSSGRISHNHVEGQWPTGISVVGSDNVIADNEVFGAVSVGFPNPAASAGDGIFVNAFAAGTRLVRNFVHGNQDDGIQTQDLTSRLGSNTANVNGDFGIDAVAGVTDLGGNTAFGNGNPAQCRNVFCQ